MTTPGEAQGTTVDFEPPEGVDTEAIDDLHNRYKKFDDLEKLVKDDYASETERLAAQAKDLESDHRDQMDSIGVGRTRLRRELLQATHAKLKEISEDPFERTTDEAYWLYAASRFSPDQLEERRQLFDTLVQLRAELDGVSRDNPALLKRTVRHNREMVIVNKFTSLPSIAAPISGIYSGKLMVTMKKIEEGETTFIEGTRVNTYDDEFGASECFEDADLIEGLVVVVKSAEDIPELAVNETWVLEQIAEGKLPTHEIDVVVNRLATLRKLGFEVSSEIIQKILEAHFKSNGTAQNITALAIEASIDLGTFIRPPEESEA